MSTGVNRILRLIVVFICVQLGAVITNSAFGAHSATSGEANSLNQMSAEEKAKFLETKFQLVNKIKLLPAAVSQALGQTEHEKTMADSDESWNVGCVGPANLPRQRLILAGTAADRCLVYFEKGGYAHFEILRLYKLGDGTTSLIWEQHPPKRFADIDAIKRAVESGQLH